MRRLAIVFALLGLVSAFSSAAQADTLTLVSRTTSSGLTASPCTGEAIAFTTVATSVFHFTRDASGASRISGTVTLSGEAAGLASGARYVFAGASHTISSFDPSQPDLFPFASTLTFVLVAQGQGPNLVQHQTALLHFNAAGEPTVDLNSVGFDCLG